VGDSYKLNYFYNKNTITCIAITNCQEFKLICFQNGDQPLSSLGKAFVIVCSLSTPGSMTLLPLSGPAYLDNQITFLHKLVCYGGGYLIDSKPRPQIKFWIDLILQSCHLNVAVNWTRVVNLARRPTNLTDWIQPDYSFWKMMDCLISSEYQSP